MRALKDLLRMAEAAGDAARVMALREDYYRQCCAELGEDHPDMLKTLGHLAAEYGKIGDLKKERELTEKLAALRGGTPQSE